MKTAIHIKKIHFDFRKYRLWYRVKMAYYLVMGQDFHVSALQEDDYAVRLRFDDAEWAEIEKQLPKVDTEAYNMGRSEGHADIAAKLRKIIDPTDAEHLNLDGLLDDVRNRF